MKKIILIFTLLLVSNLAFALTGQDELEQQSVDQKPKPLHIGNAEKDKQQQRIDQINDQATQLQQQQQKIDQMNNDQAKQLQKQRQTRALEKAQQINRR